MKQSYHTPKIVALTIITDDDDMALKSDLMVLNTEAAVQQRFSLSLETRKSDTCGFQTAKKSGWNFCSLWSRGSLALNAAVALLEKSPQLVAENPWPCFQ